MKSIIYVFVTILIIGCSQGQDAVKQFTQDALKAEIVKMNDLSRKAMLSGDFESTLQNYTKDAISLPDYQPMAKGIEALKKNVEMQKQNPMSFTKFELTSTDFWQTSNQVVDIGTYDMSMPMPQMPGGEYTDQGKYLNIYEIQIDGSLLIKVETWNSDVNPWMQMGQ
ncbi:MAG: hypothetical protein KDC88_15330 [Ignavibacteriae bacterium]|nr:hypothetical protein [Ignavibacteriota bacterium]MCB9208624.1 hypothetical protein [Ignavibacteriales bacterium]MCB9258266.1 hypothetical protein [Ignavibacteriales bacterium]